MTKATRKTTGKTTGKTAGKTTTRSARPGAATKPVSAWEPKGPTRSRGPVLTGGPVHLPKVPAHPYGQARHVADVVPGDVIYIGTPQRLSILEIADVRPAVDMPGIVAEIVALAIDLRHDGDHYDNGEQLTLLAVADTRIAVRGA